ncbi:hypothetical protein L211DRAFT_854351 [Terfezia boudieri ATCC MYA-4762]|uniref:Uncharacterized protein n=1 Tax=Terfezia boudieri ATCC MYA-4762 TaxID=1051890 RepID=A0A3N4L9R4_9PEZI|nr:hypothetical protein L211DRAFT_854351 [Terfezia boudieri ATCC MYA-4762]
MEKKEKEEQIRKHPGPAMLLTSRRQATPPAIEARQQRFEVGMGTNATPIIPGKAPRRSIGGTSVEAQTTPLQIVPGILNSTKVHRAEGKPDNAIHPGTGANATPIGPSQRQMIPGIPQLTEGKPGRVQGTRLGNRSYWNPELENTADIESVSFARSYPSERVIMIHHPPNTGYPEIIRAVARVRREMYNRNIQHLDDSTTSILQETTELVAPGLQGTRGEKAWDRADKICKDLKLTRTACLPKWLVKGKGDGYEGTKCSLRFTVTTASLRAIKSPLPIVHNKGRIYLYQWEGDKAFYMDELKYMVIEPRSSHSPEPVQTWGAYTYCHRLNHTEDTCWSKKNAQSWTNYQKYQAAAAASNKGS